MTEDTNRDEALAWLAGRLRWERLLTELADRTEATDLRTEPTEPESLEAPAPARAA